MKILIPFILLLLPLLTVAQAVPRNTNNEDFCISRSNHVPITASSNTTIRGDSINAGGANTPCITIPDNSANIHITKCRLLNSHAVNGAISIGHNCSNIEIDTNYISDSYRCVNIGGGNVASTGNNIHINYNRGLNFADAPNHPNGAGNFVQFNMITGAGNQVNNNDLLTTLTTAGTPNTSTIGDQISLFKSYGTSSSYLQVLHNCIQGGSSDPSGKSGIIAGDVGGGYQDIEFNTMVNTGSQAGQVQGGTFIIMSNNVGVTNKYSWCFEGFESGNYSGNPSNNVTMATNRALWYNKQGNRLDFYWDSSNGNPQPIGWTTNISDNTLSPNTLLQVPLFNPTCSAPVVTPPNISYVPSSNVYQAGKTIGTLTPNNSGGAVTSTYTASPALPNGIVLNATTGVISGTPTTATQLTVYVISASNTGGTSHFNLTITVTPPPVSIPVINYSPSTNVYTVGSTTSILSPVNTGGVAVSFSIDKTLPNGLSFNTTNGQISGTPSVISPATVYTVTATNSSGSGKATVTITVNSNPIQPPNISYPSNTITATYGITIPPQAPKNTGSAGGYSVSPGLPFGWNIDPNTGIITALPGSVHTTSQFVVTASNGSGSSRDTLTITVVAAPLVITAISQTKYINTPNPVLTVVYSGFLGTDNNTNALTVQPSVTTTATLNSPLGSYTITPNGAAANNYTISYSNGILEIIPANVTTITFRVIGGVVN